MKKAHHPLFGNCVFLFLNFCASLLAPNPKTARSISWDTYNTQTDYLFQSLSKETQAEPEGRIITGLIGISWANSEDDTLNGDPYTPKKES